MSPIRTDGVSQSWLRSANCDARYGVVLCSAVALLLCLCATGDAGRWALRYERSGLGDGQLWRLLTAHLVHLSLEHALLNSAGLALLWMLFAREYPPRQWGWILLGSAAAIDSGLWFLRPAVDWYLGASGVLHGVLAAGAAALYRRRDALGAALLLLLIVKLLYENSTGASVFAGNLPLLPDAHLFGALGGLIAAWMQRRPWKSL